MSRTILLSLTLFLGILSSCGNNSTSSGGANDSESGENPQGREASRNDTTIASLLADICGMKYAEAVDIDDYQARIGINMGPVPQALKEGNAVFSAAKTDFCSTQLVVLEDRFPVHYFMVLDLKHDMVSAARYELESRSLQKWTESENEEFPQLMLDWIAEMDSTPLFKVPEPTPR